MPFAAAADADVDADVTSRHVCGGWLAVDINGTCPLATTLRRACFYPVFSRWDAKV